MKFQAHRDELLRAINTASKAVPSKSTMQILYSILIDTTDGKIEMTGNDLQLGIKTDAIGFIEEPGKVCIDARMFSEIIRKFPSDDVRIQTDADNKVTIKSGKSVFHIAGKDAEDFTSLPKVEHGDEIILGQSQLKKVIQQTIFSISINDSNRMMTGAFVQIHDDEMRITALDGHRVAIRQVTLAASHEDCEAIIPGKTLQEISKILSDDHDREVYIGITNNHATFRFDGTTVVSSLIQGKYFEVNKMLTDEYETLITANKGHLVSSIDRSLIFTSESDKRPVVMSVSAGNLNMKIQSGTGSFTDDIPVNQDGNDLRIGVNPKFVLDVLKVIEGDEVSIYFLAQSRPMFIRDEEKSYIYMVLPVSI